MVHSLGSRTSGVDGSSEGGRINTINLPGALVIYGVALLQTLQRPNPKSKLSVAPVQADATLSLQHLSDAHVDLGMVVRPGGRHAQAATEDFNWNRPDGNQAMQRQQPG